MTGSVKRITLESLLDNTYYESVDDYSDAPEDPTEVAIECADILEELNSIELELVTLEAGKAVKKAKSASKKKKIVKSKMKAKDAKSKKAGGKVIKIVKESDAELDGGTGPQPTTTDTMGMTDTDLDADPEAEVQVSEVDDSVTDESAIVGMEGVDFIVEYEDPYIVKMEDSIKQNLKAFGNKVVEFLKNIGKFFASIFKKLVSMFQNIDGLVSKNKAEIATGLKSDKEISTKYTLKGAAEINKLSEAIRDGVSDIRQATDSDKAKAVEQAEGLIFNFVESGKAKLKDCGFTSPEDLIAVGGKQAQTKFKGVFDTAMSFIKAQENNAKALISKDDTTAKEQLKGIQTSANGVRKMVSIAYKTYGKACALALKVTRAAIGAKASPDSAALTTT